MRTVGINETFVTVLEDVYTGAAARVDMDNQVAEKIPILTGVRQGYPVSPKLFPATIHVFKYAQLEAKGINIDGEELLDLRFADIEHQ